jgi:formylglycine-generating enzyme required for sulfatase activity
VKASVQSCSGYRYWQMVDWRASVSPVLSNQLIIRERSCMTPEHFPPRLAQLGFQARVINGIEAILPPVCEVPAGAFLMGSNPKRDPVVAKEKQRFDDEQPQHRVLLPGYTIARFPVTVAEYACFVRAWHREPQRNTFIGGVMDWPAQLQRMDYPVVNMTWHDARSYGGWLSFVTGESWRLPTEAEWEKAARGTDGRIYPCGDTFEEQRCNTKESEKNTTTPIGTYPEGASPYGVQDMAGNVWEWVSTLHFSYPYSLSDRREGPNDPDYRVLRGGSWHADARFARAAFRWSSRPGNFDDNTGFRVVQAAYSQ